MLPYIALVDSHGRIYDGIDPHNLPENAAWAKTSVDALMQEMAPTGDKAKDFLKDKLLHVFNRSNGRVIFTQGKQNLALLYETNPGKDPVRQAPRIQVWISKMLPGPKAGELTGHFHRRYTKNVPEYRIVFDATSFPLMQHPHGKCKITNPDQSFSVEKFGDPAEFAVNSSPMIHELVHGATAAGHFLSTGDTSGNNSGTVIDSPLFKSLCDFEDLFFAGSTAMVSGGLFKTDKNYTGHQEALQDEILAYASCDYFGSGTQSPLVNQFFKYVVPYELDLILNGDRTGRERLLNALEDRRLFEIIVKEGKKITDVIKDDVPVKVARAARQKFVDRIGEALERVITDLRANSRAISGFDQRKTAAGFNPTAS